VTVLTPTLSHKVGIIGAANEVGTPSVPYRSAPTLSSRGRTNDRSKAARPLVKSRRLHCSPTMRPATVRLPGCWN